MNNQIYEAIREALHELRTEQDIQFKTIADEKFAIGYIAKTVFLFLNKKENNAGS
jgi:hypothetical protein